MTTNSNIGGSWPDANKSFAPNGLGSDNPGQTTCGNCRRTVVPVPINGLRQYAEASAPDDYTAAAPLTSAGYSCPCCGHNLTWIKSTGKDGGPALVGNTNQPTAPDM